MFFKGLRPRRRSRNEDNSGSKNNFKKRLKKQPKVCENDDFSGSGAELQKHRPKLPPRPSPGPSRERPGRPKTAPRSAKSCPRRGKSGPRTAKTAPRGHQERLQNWSKKHQKWTSALGWPPGAPGSHFGPNFEPPGSHFRTILERTLACIFDPPVLHFGTSAVMAWQVNGWSAVAAEPYSIQSIS